MLERIEIELGGRPFSIDTGHVARQANGVALVRHGDTVIMSAVVASKEPMPDKGFFPLQVDYREKAYAAGRIPGGFFKREGRPTEKETLSARMIDRPIRPLFPDGFDREVQIHVTVLCSDQENDADVLGICSTAAALAFSDIPTMHTVAGVRVGRVNGEFVVNPTQTQLEETDLNIVMAATKDDIVMVEGGCDEISEEDLANALQFGQQEIRKIVNAIEELRGRIGKEKMPVTPPETDEELETAVRNLVAGRVADAVVITEKQEREAALDLIKKETIESLSEQFPEQERVIGNFIGDMVKHDLRERILTQSLRADGRGPDDIRQITGEVNFLPRTHGSALFTRGQTQALATVTLGTKVDEQRIEGLMGDSTRSYMLHYNFPHYSVGEIKPIRGPGRREIGHGALAERAIRPVIPNEDIFPYTIRIVSEILESNGSSSMATVCGGTLALMDAGVPIKSPVGGIAMGLVMSEGKHAVLTDILGVEDHLGDMDFKVTGTRDGITAFQMDLKIQGLPFEILREALEKACIARNKVLDRMEETLAAPRPEISKWAPRILIFQIKVSRIGDVIGPGGKKIRGICEETGAKVDINDDGTVIVASVDMEAAETAKKMILAQIEEPEVDKVYEGVVRRVASFGAFLEILPGTDGLLHISEIDHARTERVEDVLKVGDTLEVKVISIDDDGKVRLSRRVLLPRPEGMPEVTPSRRPPRRNNDRRPARRRT
jgi:polyribonucleotide nucleotidyltransferase